MPNDNNNQDSKNQPQKQAQRDRAQQQKQQAPKRGSDEPDEVREIGRRHGQDPAPERE